MNELFSCLHKALVEYDKGDVGVSFPNVDKTLGALLRLHGHQSSLEQLMAILWTNRIKDNVSISAITPIPEDVSYRVVKRFQTKSSTERLIRRSVRKGWLTQEEASLRISNKSEKLLSLPYLRIKSLSTRQIFLLFVEHGPILTTPVTGAFSAYGLSSNATIPWF